ncbi:hypothetical protein [Photorhabdus aballayi]|uniref:hypothetical protein n=1 Tax=Photorhabdus aballayi TaxID=2991723 RepID=UPI00223DD3EF|nr:hypothetical protein [Photorhabdus aballayi]
MEWDRISAYTGYPVLHRIRHIIHRQTVPTVTFAADYRAAAAIEQVSLAEYRYNVLKA